MALHIGYAYNNHLTQDPGLEKIMFDGLYLISITFLSTKLREVTDLIQNEFNPEYCLRQLGILVS